MCKTLEEIIRGELMGLKEIGNMDFETLDDMVGDSISDNRNLYYIESKTNMLSLIRKKYFWKSQQKKNYNGRWGVNMTVMENFGSIEIEDLAQVLV